MLYEYLRLVSVGIVSFWLGMFLTTWFIFRR